MFFIWLTHINHISLYSTNKNNIMKTYTATQIERAKAQYNNFAQYRTVESFEPEFIGWSEAEQRAEFHNRIVEKIKANDAETVKEWKLFFLKSVARADFKETEKKEKLKANKEASADILSEIKAQKRIVEFGKWLNTTGNPFRKEHFSKKYTQESVMVFLNNN